MTPPAIEATSVYRFYHAGPEETLALRGVSLTVQPGEIVAVAGPSGSGKSTLLSVIVGTDDPDGGSVFIAGAPMSRQPERERAQLRRERIGILSQTSDLLYHLTVRGNVCLAQRIRGNPRPPARPPDEALDLAGIAHRADSYPDQLSGGEVARAGLAVALANSPSVLVADEPTGELDTATEQALLDVLVTLAAAGTAVLIASHSPDVLARAHRVVRLVDGVVADAHL